MRKDIRMNRQTGATTGTLIIGSVIAIVVVSLVVWQIVQTRDKGVKVEETASAQDAADSKEKSPPPPPLGQGGSDSSAQAEQQTDSAADQSEQPADTGTQLASASESDADDSESAEASATASGQTDASAAPSGVGTETSTSQSPGQSPEPSDEGAAESESSDSEVSSETDTTTPAESSQTSDASSQQSGDSGQSSASTSAAGSDSLKEPHLVRFDAYESDVTLDQELQDYLDKVKAFLKDSPQWKLAVIGHSDKSGPKEFNVDVAQERADAMALRLQGEGFTKSQLVVESEGESDPLVPNDSAENRAKNRRVELILRKP